MGVAPDLLVRVVAGGQRDGAASRVCRRMIAGDDVEQFGGHRDDPFAVGLGRGDHQQGDDLAVGALVLADAELGELKQLLDAETGVPQDLDDRPVPERGLLLDRDDDQLAGVAVHAPESVVQRRRRAPFSRVVRCR